jgi:hypothetical protein
MGADPAAPVEADHLDRAVGVGSDDHRGESLNAAQATDHAPLIGQRLPVGGLDRPARTTPT